MKRQRRGERRRWIISGRVKFMSDAPETEEKEWIKEVKMNHQKEVGRQGAKVERWKSRNVDGWKCVKGDEKRWTGGKKG